MSPRRWKPTAMLVGLCAIWGGTFPATKAALELTDPVQFLALRWSLALLLFLPIRSKIPRPAGYSGDQGLRPWLAAAGVGILMLTGFTLQAVGMQDTTASRSALFTGLLVVMTPLIAGALQTSRMPRTGWLGVLSAWAGVFILSGATFTGLSRGDVLTIICAAAFSLHMVALEAFAARFGDLRILATAQLLVMALGAGLWAAVAGRPFQLDAAGLLAVLYTGALGGTAAVYLQSRYQPEVPVGYAALVFTLEPVFAGLFAYLLLNEPWTLSQFVGAAFIVAGMATASVAGLPAKTTPTG